MPKITPAHRASNSQAKRWDTILGGAVILVALLMWIEWRALASTHHTLATAQDQWRDMRHNAQAVQMLRNAPKAAAARTKRHEELLALIERCLAQAGIEPSAWRQSVPEPPVRLPQSDYRRMNTRVYIEKVSIKQLAAFAHHLHAADSTLEVTAVNLTNREHAAATYDVDLLVSYNVYAPQRERSTGGNRKP